MSRDEIGVCREFTNLEVISCRKIHVEYLRKVRGIVHSFCENLAYPTQPLMQAISTDTKSDFGQRVRLLAAISRTSFPPDARVAAISHHRISLPCGRSTRLRSVAFSPQHRRPHNVTAVRVAPVGRPYGLTCSAPRPRIGAPEVPCQIRPGYGSVEVTWFPLPGRVGV